MFPDIPPKQTQPAALVRSAESAEARLVRIESASFLEELRGAAREVLQSRARIIAQGRIRAEEDLSDAKDELGNLNVFEYFSTLGTALSKQVYLEERRIRHFAEQQERLAGLFVTLERAEKLVEIGRFEESVPLLKELKRETYGRFPSEAFLNRLYELSRRVEPTR